MASYVTSMLFMPLTKLKGVGENRKEDYKRLGIYSIRDAVYHLPISYIFRKKIEDFSDEFLAQNIIFEAKVEQIIPAPYSSRAPARIIIDANGTKINIIYFNASKKFLEYNFKINDTYLISGKPEKMHGQIQIIHPEYVVAANSNQNIPSVEPVYPLTYKLSNKMVYSTIKNAVANTSLIPEWLPESFLHKKNWPSWNKAIYKCHHIETKNDFDYKAPHRERLAFDEILAQQLSLQLVRKNIKKEICEKFSFKRSLEKKLLDLLPFNLTLDQSAVIEEIVADMESGFVMNRMVQGDVGCGKTLVALCAMLNIYESGAKACLMAPTSLLAKQHYENIRKLCDDLDVSVVFLSGSMKAKERKDILAKLESDQPLIVVGTHALFQDKINFTNLKLAIIDEQHRFGVEQRLNLTKKGVVIHFLMMSATPIPRTVQMLSYGDLDCSIIATKPANRLEVKTTLLSEYKINDLKEHLNSVLSKNEKVYWICPLIEESEKINLSNVENRFNDLKNAFGEKVVYLHGKMQVEEREQLMDEFANGDKQILVATTVIEVGVDVADATVIIIENAERFGLAQLHQLRGRVGRSDKQSYCVLLYSKHVQGALVSRLKAMQQTSDGFKLAEEDLKIRGGGEILGYKQSGLPSFKIANPEVYNYLINEANQLAKYIMHQDPCLTKDFKNIKFLLEIFEFDKLEQLISQ